MQDVRRSAARRLRHRVSADVRASGRDLGPGRDFAVHRTDAKHGLVGGSVPGGRAHCVINSAARLAGSAIFAGGHCRIAAAIVGIRGRQGRSRSKTEANP